MKINLPIHPENLSYEVPACWQRPFGRVMRLGRVLFFLIVLISVIGLICEAVI